MTNAPAATEHPFQAEVDEILSLVINSLYSNKDIFLRELLSNASDALDKQRFSSIGGEGSPEVDSEPLRIRLLLDEAARTLTIDDNGVGMSHDELVKNLGTVAHSGTREFLAQLKDNPPKNGQAASSLIGQFGVGFYSAYLVADRVEVVSKKQGATEAWRWASTAKKSFTLEPAERAGRGSSVILHLQEEHKEMCSPWKIKDLVSRYSDYITFPIELREPAAKKNGDDVDAAAAPAETFTRINQARALWQRPARDITDEQYNELYTHMTHDHEAPLARKHFKVEGTQEFSGVLFVPRHPPFDLFQSEAPRGLRLHVKRVFIMDNCEDLLPRWLRFLRGVVDSEDLPLNVSRELLQDSRAVRVIKKSIVKHALDMLEECAEQRPDDYVLLWRAYGSILKEGLHFEIEHKERIAKLVRYESSRVEGITSLAQYVERMPEGQKSIFYAVGPNKKTVASSPHLEVLTKRGSEVLYMVDPVDQLAVQGLSTFDEKPLVSAMDASLRLDDVPSTDEKKDEPPTEGFAGLLTRIQTVLGDHVSQVRASDRLTDSPVCLVIAEGGIDPHLERMLRMQRGTEMPMSKRIFEVNPHHPLIESLAALHARDPAHPLVQEHVELLYDQALLAEGSPVDDPARVAQRLTRLMAVAAARSLEGAPA